MKVILTAEVKGKGHEGDVVEVARGYAVNYLLPRKMAIHATAGNLKQLEARTSNIRKRNEQRETDARGIAGALDGKAIVIEAKAGEEGKLFGSVTGLMIEEAIAKQLGYDVDHKRMDLHKPIKTTGEHHVTLSVFGDVKAEFVVTVVPEGGAAKLAAQAETSVDAPVDAPEPDASEAVETAVEPADAEVVPVDLADEEAVPESE
jgi:large subunit ribosomal protein L9